MGLSNGHLSGWQWRRGGISRATHATASGATVAAITSYKWRASIGQQLAEWDGHAACGACYTAGKRRAAVRHPATRALVARIHRHTAQHRIMPTCDVRGRLHGHCEALTHVRKHSKHWPMIARVALTPSELAATFFGCGVCIVQRMRDATIHDVGSKARAHQDVVEK